MCGLLSRPCVCVEPEQIVVRRFAVGVDDVIVDSVFPWHVPGDAPVFSGVPEWFRFADETAVEIGVSVKDTTLLVQRMQEV